MIRRTRLTTVCDPAFPVVGSCLWNSLLHGVISSLTLAVFRNRLKTYLFTFYAIISLLTVSVNTVHSGEAVHTYATINNFYVM